MNEKPLVDCAEVFGRIVAQLRERAGLSSRDLAARLQIGSASVGRLETGNVMPTFLVAAKVAAALRAPVGDRRPEPWTALLLFDVQQHVLHELSRHYRPAWNLNKKSPGTPIATGKAVAGAVQLPVLDWLAKMEAAGWPQSVLDRR